jgi:hypothetical protein
MGKAEFLRSSKSHVRLGGSVLLALCLLTLLAGPARAAENAPSPEPAPPSAAAQGGVESPTPESPTPESAPQAERPSPAPAEPSSQPAAPVSEPPSAPAESEPRRLPVRGTRSNRVARSRRAHAARHTTPTHHARARKQTQAKRGSAILASPTVSGVSGHADGTLLLLTSGALGVLALAGLTLVRLLMRLERLSHEGFA